MTTLITVSRDLGVLRRWSAALDAAGHDSSGFGPDDWAGRPAADGMICLYDLGPRSGGEQHSLLAALDERPAIRFVAMTARPTAEEGLPLLQKGVRGYCNRLASPTVLGALISTVDSGEIWAGRQVTDYLLSSVFTAEPSAAPRPSPDLFDRLTVREKDIALQVAAGCSNKVIATDSGISERTVKAHLNAIFRKTGIRNRVQLALAVSQLTGDDRLRSGGRA